MSISFISGEDLTFFMWPRRLRFLEGLSVVLFVALSSALDPFRRKVRRSFMVGGSWLYLEGVDRTKDRWESWPSRCRDFVKRVSGDGEGSTKKTRSAVC